MKKTILFILLTSITLFSYAQCPQGSAYLSPTAPIYSTGNCGAPIIVSGGTCNFNEEYATYSGLIVGNSYTAGNCSSVNGTDGGAAGSEITVRNGSSGNGTVLGFANSASSGVCVTFTATSTSVTVQVNDPGCVTSSNCNALGMICNNCPPDPMASSATCNTTNVSLTEPSCSAAGMNLSGGATSAGAGGSVVCGTSFPVVFPAQTTAGGACPSGGGGTGTTYGCLGSQPNPSWFALQTDATGNICLNMTNSANLDIDFAMWGPIPVCGASFNANCLGAPLDCDYTASPGGQLNVTGAPAGSTYFVLVTNFDGTATNISMANNCPVPTTAGLACPAPLAPQPIGLSMFKGYVLQNGNTITWTTNAETNNSHFEVEYSLDGKTFNTIGNIASQALHGNSSSILNYTYDHLNPTFGHNYYRLKQTDLNGSTSTSFVIDLERKNGSTSLSVSPNPAIDNVELNIQSANVSKINIIISDLTGKIVFNQTQKTSIGSNKYKINTAVLPAGIYTIEVKENLNKSIYSKFSIIK